MSRWPSQLGMQTVRCIGHCVPIPGISLQVQEAATTVCSSDLGFGPREFAYLYRRVCGDADPYSELIRSFEVFDPEKKNEVSLEEVSEVLATCFEEWVGRLSSACDWGIPIWRRHCGLQIARDSI